MNLVYFSSKSQNTHRFVLKLELPCHRIPLSKSETLTMEAPFVLVLATYAGNDGEDAIPPQVEQFITDPNNNALLRGVVAGGNRNFGKYYAYAGYVISKRYNVPLLHRFELLGTPDDVLKVKTKLQGLQW